MSIISAAKFSVKLIGKKFSDKHAKPSRNKQNQGIREQLFLQQETGLLKTSWQQVTKTWQICL